MVKLNLLAEKKDLLILYNLCKSYFNGSFEKFVEEECEKEYIKYTLHCVKMDRLSKTYTQWVSAQIIAITNPWD